MENAFRSPNFGEPRSSNTIKQLESANRLSQGSLGFKHRIPWAVQIVSDWGRDGKRLESQVWNYAGRKEGVSVYELSHDVTPFNIREAALLLESNLRLAVPRTIFVCVVDPTVGSDRLPIAVEAGTGNGPFLLGPHNGVFDLLLRGLNAVYGLSKVVGISRESRHVISISEGGVKAVDGDAIFAPAAGAIARAGGIPADLGCEIPLSEFGEVRKWEEAWRKGRTVAGRIEHIDHYGSFVTNIPAALLEGWKKSCDGWLSIRNDKGYGFKVKYAEHFAAVAKDAPVVLPQGNAFLHIAVNQNRAVELLEFKRGDRITLEPADPEYHFSL